MRIYRRHRKDIAGQRVEYGKWQVSWRDEYNAQWHTWPGFDEPKPESSRVLGESLERLAQLKLDHAPIDERLQRYIDNLPDRFKDRLVEINLLDPAYLKRGWSIDQHLDKWEASIMADRTAKHAKTLKLRTKRVFGLANISRLSDIEPPRLNAAIADLASPPHSFAPITRRHHRQAVYAFLRWASSEQLLPHFNLGALKPVRNAKTKRTRTALSVDEHRRLLAVTANAEDFTGNNRAGEKAWSIPAADRVLVYRLVLETGLRSNEIRHLTAADFNLLATVPTVRLRNEHEKNRRGTTFRLKVETALLLRDHLVKTALAAPAFSFPPRDRVVIMARSDLAAARAGWVGEAEDFEQRQVREKTDTLLPERHSGAVFDFHALRKTFVTNMARAGVPISTAVKLARHSDPRLTISVYTEVGQSDTAAALDLLPDYEPEDDVTTQRATGTRGEQMARQVVGRPAERYGAGRDSAAHGMPVDEPKTPFSKPPVGLEPTTCGLQNRCSAN